MGLFKAKSKRFNGRLCRVCSSPVSSPLALGTVLISGAREVMESRTCRLRCRQLDLRSSARSLWYVSSIERPYSL